MPEFVPVEHDPFKQPSTIESGRFVPVEHDPFAASPSEQPSLVAADFTNLSVDINPANGEGMNIDTEKLKTAFTDARTMTQLSGVQVEPSYTYKNRDGIDEFLNRNFGQGTFGRASKSILGMAEGLGTFATGAAAFTPSLLAGTGELVKQIMEKPEDIVSWIADRLAMLEPHPLSSRADSEQRLAALKEPKPFPLDFKPALETQQKVAEALTLKPRTETGQAVAHVGGYVFEKYSEALRSIAPKGEEDKYEFIGNAALLFIIPAAAKGIKYVPKAYAKYFKEDPLIKDTIFYEKLVDGKLLAASPEESISVMKDLYNELKAKGASDADLAKLSAGFKKMAIETRSHGESLPISPDYVNKIVSDTAANLPDVMTAKEPVPYATTILLESGLDISGDLIKSSIEKAASETPITADMSWQDAGSAIAQKAITALGEDGKIDVKHPITWAREHQARVEAGRKKAVEQSQEEVLQKEAAAGITPKQPEVKEPTHKEIVDSFAELSDEDMAKRVEELIPAPPEALLEHTQLKEPPPSEQKAAPVFKETTTVQDMRMQSLMGADDNMIVAKDKGKELGYLWYTKEPDGGFSVRKIESFIKKQGAATALTNEVVAKEGVLKGFTDVTPDGLAFFKAYAEKYPQNVSPELKQRLTEISAERAPDFKLALTEMPKAKIKPPVQVDSIKGIQHEMPKTSIKTIEAGDPMLAELTKREEEKRQMAIPETRVIKEKKAIAANPETDSLATYIRKNGGFNYQKEHMKGELDRLSKKEAGTTGLISKSGKGYTLDQMLGKAIEDGYFNENATINDLIDTLENEVYMKKKSWSTMKIWTDEAIGEVMKDGMASEEKRLSSLLADLNDAIGEEGKIGKGGADMSKVMPILSKIGNKIYAEGHKTYEQFSNRMKEISGTAYSKIKDFLYRVWQAVKQFNERLGERGAIGISKEERIALKEKGFSDKQISVMTNEEMNKLFPKREQVREATGQVKDGELVNLRYAFIKAGQAARKAFRAGKIEVAEQEKQKLVDILDRSKKINAVRDYFGLTDAEMKKVSRRNPFLMSQYEFKIYLDDVRQKALEMAENSFEKSRIMYHIFNKDLKKVNNYRMALELPPITKMTTEQAAQFADLLEPFQEGDEFLTLRELETVDRTDLAGIRTWREARERLAKETGITVEELNKIKVTEFDKYRWDAVLVERNPFYKMMVTETTKKLLEGNLRIHDVENKVFELARKSQKSKKRSLLERAIPQDKEIIEYLEAPMEDKEAIGKEMTPEQLDYANYIQTYFRNALEYLIKENALEKGRENYFVHVRRSFFENAKEEGLIKAVKDIFKSYQEDMATFQILDKDTGNILPLEKFFQFALHRSGVIEPSANATKAFLTYVKTFEKKISLDEIIPKIDIYAQSLTPQRLTPRGLEKDRSIKTFVNEYINNKKGRRIDQMVGKQGGVIDVGIRAAKTFTTLLDLGLNIPVGLTSYVGESVTNLISLGIKKHALGAIRDKTKKGRAIVKKYEAWTDRSIWENFKAPGKEIQERFSDALFGLFHQSMVDANRHFLLGSLTKEEWNSGELNSKRLAELQLEMGRWRVVPGTKSLVGSTALGSAAMQYKTWAAPIISATVKDVSTLITDLKSKSVGEALTTREAREIYRIIGITSTMLVAGAMVTADNDDKGFIGQLLSKAYRESLTLLQGVDPSLWLATPRILGFLTELGKNLHALILLEEYKTEKKKGELKGVKGLEKQITPRAIKQFQEKTIGNNQLPPKR